MPLMTFCSCPGCSNAVPFGVRYCKQHETKAKQEDRKGANERGYTYKWQQASKSFLASHPLCVRCEAMGLITEAAVVDHIKPHRGDKRLFWDRSNWQPLCKRCHDIKTATEDGGFGRGAP